MPNPFMRGRVVTSKTDVNRPVAIEPAPEEYAGDNIPYRGIENHGVAGSVDFRDTAEDMQDHDGREVIVYDVPEDDPHPIPVRIVNRSSVERRAFRPVISYATGTDNGSRARAILNQDESRTRATIFNKSIDAAVWISDKAETANSVGGFYLPANGSYSTESQEAIYATVDKPADLPIYIAVEYRKNLDD